MNKKDKAFSGAAGGLGAGIDALFATEGNPNEFDLMANLDDIEIVAQVREEFESRGCWWLVNAGCAPLALKG